MLLLLGCAHPTPPVEPPPPIEGAAVSWFDLEGHDRIDLLESCLDRCPRNERGDAVASLTSWTMDWSWTRGAAEACEVAGANVNAAVSVELPRWDAPDDADPALVAEWDAWHTALRHHEQGHVEVVHVYAHDAEAIIADAGCDGAELAGARLLDGLRHAQAEYDAETGNGHAQGASFWRVNGR